ncbi:HNH endonuclease signature motif containing protein [Actinotalea solisilvae]|uniref:HNH endonuclease signature motif containing protein n=1 Tax=Actinotalea solisilvae TaxID=2072922 RepID=UPI0018F138F6|nr:HNH endonuclease signature motif containing protein [Actinotalea solisilvae]
MLDRPPLRAPSASLDANPREPDGDAWPRTCVGLELDLEPGARPEVVLVERAAHLLAPARTAHAWSVEERRHAMRAIDQVVGVLTALRGDLLLAERDAGAWRTSGDPSFEAWRARTSRAGAGAVRSQVRQAEAAAQLPAVREAVVAGATTTAHLDALARVVAQAAPPVQAALAAPAVQAELVDAARRMDAPTFARAAARVAARLDPVAHERSHQAQRAARFLHLADTPDGTRINGLVDRMAGHRLRLALEAVSPRPAQDDDRTPEQRRADALDTLAEKVLAAPETLSGAAVRPHVSFHMTEATWAGLRALRSAAAEVDADASAFGGLEPVALDDGSPVPLSEVARALCDCELTRIVLDADGAPLDVGRTQRTYTGAQRRAVVARDRGCGWNGCAAQARWCEVHHIRWWDRDTGPTSVDNGVLLCSFHHHEVHRRDLAIRRVSAPPGDPPGTRYVFTDPTGRALSPPPPGPSRAP